MSSVKSSKIEIYLLRYGQIHSIRCRYLWSNSIIDKQKCELLTNKRAYAFISAHYQISLKRVINPSNGNGIRTLKNSTNWFIDTFLFVLLFHSTWCMFVCFFWCNRNTETQFPCDAIKLDHNKAEKSDRIKCLTRHSVQFVIGAVNDLPSFLGQYAVFIFSMR